jgi:hypothetical protein
MGLTMKRCVRGWVVAAGVLAVSMTAGSAFALGQTGTPGPAVTNVVEPPTPLLPTNDRLVANDALAAVPADKPETATVLTESGLKRTETRAAVGGAATASGWVRAYQFVDATGAFAAYTYFRQGGKAYSGERVNATETQLPGGEIVFLSGVSVVRAQVKQSPEAVNSLLKSVWIGLPKIGGRHGLPPLLPTMLPKAGLDEAGVRYALGPVEYQAMGGLLPAEILGWDKSAEVATAAYNGKGGRGTLTLLMYPTPQIAAERGRAIEQAVNQRGQASFGGVKLRRLGPLVEMASGGFTPQQAQALVESVHLNEEVTFDKAMPTEFHTEIRKTATLLQSIAMFVGVGILAALVLGVFLGGARAGIRVMQGKPAASEPEFLTIDLRGRPAPLQASGSAAGEAEQG